MKFPARKGTKGAFKEAKRDERGGDDPRRDYFVAPETVLPNEVASPTINLI